MTGLKKVSEFLDQKDVLDELETWVDEDVGWVESSVFQTMRFQISQGFDVFSHEVQQKDLTQFTSVHPTN